MSTMPNVYRDVSVVIDIKIANGETESEIVNCTQLGQLTTPQSVSAAGSLRVIEFPVGFPATTIYLLGSTRGINFSPVYFWDSVNCPLASFASIGDGQIISCAAPIADSIRYLKIKLDDVAVGDQIVTLTFQPIYQGAA